MPVILNDIQKSVPVKVYTPKFFDSKLTGAGKKIGLLNDKRNPMHIDPKQTTSDQNIHMRHRHFSNGQATITFIPFYILGDEGWECMSECERPDLADLVCIAEKSQNGQPATEKLYVSMAVHSLMLEEIEQQYRGGGSAKKNLTACYQLFFWKVDDENDTVMHYAVNGSRACTGAMPGNRYAFEFTCNPLRMIRDTTDDIAHRGWDVDDKAINAFIDDYNLYDAICLRSEQWQTTIHDLLKNYFKQVGQKVANCRAVNDTHSANAMLNGVCHVLHRIEDYNVPLDLYRDIYASLKASFDADDVVVLCKQNLNLLLSDTLNHLNQNKPSLTKLPTPAQPIAIDSYFSQEQRRAITSDEPLILVQAGAGTGKSTVVLARIKYMVDSGIPPEDITVLSFTNAAADHITEKNPFVHSMTIASMIHTIYTANFKNHELSTIDTIINSLDIYFPNDDFAYEFRGRLMGVNKNDRDSFTRMNNFIERNYDKVMNVLNTIGQTSLELEIIICYQQIENLVEPPEVQSRYLIIDEVQDNSIFEFVYTLKYVDKHKEALFMVGDCSQTLYEFRASNPKALNVLEGSGVFATYQLQTNYRSNQEILDFANVVLSDIEANQYANIQLHANNLAPVTEQSFAEKVQLRYERLSRLAEATEAIRSILATELYKYLDEKLAAGEQVAFLAYTRKMVSDIQEMLQKHYPNCTTVSLVPEKVYNSTIFSAFIKKYWGDIKFVPSRSVVGTITGEIWARLSFLVSNANKAQNRVRALLADWANDIRPSVQVWERELQSGRMSQDEFLTHIRNHMLQYEIRKNAIKQSLISARNQENKQNQDVANANFLLSTIHSAKGLEFDNTVVIYRAENDMDEDKKRMYYVALTRAMKSEFIVAYDTVAKPKIESDYEMILDGLHKKAAAKMGQTLSADGVTVVTESEADDDDDAANSLQKAAAMSSTAIAVVPPAPIVKVDRGSDGE